MAEASTGRGEKAAQAGGWRDPSLLWPGEQDKPPGETDREKARHVTRGRHGGEGGDVLCGDGVCSLRPNRARPRDGPEARRHGGL